MRTFAFAVAAVAVAAACFGGGLLVGFGSGQRSACARAQDKAFNFIRCVDGVIYSVNDPESRPGLPDAKP